MENTLQIDIKKICLDILVEFDAFCRKNNLKYSLAYGTAIGAVRHSGYIPWDDDIDVMMPRSDYEKLLSIFSNDGNYKLFNDSMPDYYYQYAKIVDVNYPIKEFNRKEKLMGLWIDIFPVEYISSDNNSKKTKKQLNFYNHAIWYSGTLKKSKNKTIKNMIMNLMIDVCGDRFFLKKHRLYIKNHCLTGGNICFASAYPNIVFFPYDIFDDIIDINFEGHTMKLTSHYNDYLSTLYGDYMELPPKKMQVAHHLFELI